MVWCPTSAMVADIMTKCLSLELFERHQNALGILDVVENQTFLPWRVMGMMFSQVLQRLPDLQNEMLQVEELVADSLPEL